jgi:DNA-binding NarL/FixJ family response regulator
MHVVEASAHASEDAEHRTDGGFTTSIEVSAPSEAPRVLVIDSNLLTAEAIVVALTQMKFSVRFVVPVTTRHLRDLVTWKPELALLDIDSVDSATCLDCVTILRGAGVPVAVMGGRPDTYLLGECVQAGASSVVDKSSPLNDLIGTIARLLAGDVVLSESEKRQLTEHYQRETRVRRARLAPFDVLTHREKCVLAELMEGNCAEVIARRASVSISTVRSQIKAILQKLGVNSQLAAAALARQAGWFHDSSNPGGTAVGAGAEMTA